MAKREPNALEECKAKIKALLREYNCSIEWDDYHPCVLHDDDTGESVRLDE